MKRTGPDSGRRERWLLAGICGFAALRVLLMSATFPFFNNVDEPAHVDAVLKYARGSFPDRSAVRYDALSARLFVLYGTWEYLSAPQRFRGGAGPRPAWERPPEQVAALVARSSARWARTANHEVHSPPAYYVLAGMWHRVGSALGLGGIQALYWARFLNASLIAFACWLAWRLCGDGFPERPDLRLGVPLLLAVLPQDAFYSINSDVLSVPLFTLSLWLLLRWSSAEDPRPWLSAALGASVAATLLVKLTNVVLLVLVAAVVALQLRRAWHGGRARRALFSAAIMAMAAFLPVAAFAMKNRATVGDWTGTGAKVAALGWSQADLTAVWTHPILTPGGLWTLWDGVLRTLWRGEFVWHGTRMAYDAVDLFFSLSSALLLAAVAVDRFRSSRAPARLLSWSAFAFVASILCLAALSVSFDFGDAGYPSRGHPFFTSGRLILGALVPFLVLYIEGIAALTGRRGTQATLIGVGIVCAVATIPDLWLTAPVWSSPYNWFHLP